VSPNPPSAGDPTPLRFDLSVVPGGYAWWYLDGISDDGAHGLTIILFVGSVFSPSYARARKCLGSGRDGEVELAAAERFCAVNVALYDLREGGRAGAWALNEHADFARDRESLRIGSSSVRWTEPAPGQPELVIELDERATLFFGRPGPPLRGRVRLRPATIFAPRVELDRWQAAPRHRWYPVAPHARVEVELDEPKLRFSGSGYHDVNEGDEGLEQGFASWNWLRCDLGEATTIAYDVIDHAGRPHARAWRFAAERGEIEAIPEGELGPAVALPTTRWGVARAVRSDPGHPPSLVQTLEDAPFYSRNLVRVRLGGREGAAMHESIDLRRFARAWVRFLLGFKINRRRAGTR
jgi:carotenoid 1,2-hydratase